MTDDAILVLECLFDSIWMLFTSWYIPGTDVTPAGAFMFFAFAGLALRFLYRLVGLAPTVDGEKVVGAVEKVYPSQVPAPTPPNPGYHSSSSVDF